MFPSRQTVAITSASGGAATEYTPNNVRGRILSVIYAKTDFADGVDFTITTEETAQNVWVEPNVNASKTVCPRQLTHTTTGAELATDTTAAGSATEYIYAANERLKFAITNAGNTKSGTFDVLIG